MDEHNPKPDLQIKGLTARWRMGVKGPGTTAAIIASAVILAIGLVVASSAGSSGWLSEPDPVPQAQVASPLAPEQMVEMHDLVMARANLRLTIMRLHKLEGRARELGTDVEGLDILIDQLQQLYDTLDPQRKAMS